MTARAASAKAPRAARGRPGVLVTLAPEETAALDARDATRRSGARRGGARDGAGVGPKLFRGE